MGLLLKCNFETCMGCFSTTICLRTSVLYSKGFFKLGSHVNSLKAHLCSKINMDIDTDRLFSILCVHFICISTRFHKAYGHRPNGAVPLKNHGGSVSATTWYFILMRHEEEITMVKLFKEKHNVFNSLTDHRL